MRIPLTQLLPAKSGERSKSRTAMSKCTDATERWPISYKKTARHTIAFRQTMKAAVRFKTFRRFSTVISIIRCRVRFDAASQMRG